MKVAIEGNFRENITHCLVLLFSPHNILNSTTENLSMRHTKK